MKNINFNPFKSSIELIQNWYKAAESENKEGLQEDNAVNNLCEKTNQLAAFIEKQAEMGGSNRTQQITQLCQEILEQFEVNKHDKKETESFIKWVANHPERKYEAYQSLHYLLKAINKFEASVRKTSKKDALQSYPSLKNLDVIDSKISKLIGKKKPFLSNYETFSQFIKNEASKPENQIDVKDLKNVIKFFEKNKSLLKGSFFKFSNDLRDNKLGKAILILLDRIRTAFPEKIKNDPKLKKLLKKIDIFGSTRAVTTQESRGPYMNAKGVFNEILGFLPQKALKKMGTISTEWRERSKDPEVLLKSINLHPEIPIIEYFSGLEEKTIKFIELYGSRLNCLNLRIFSKKEIKNLNFEKFKELKYLNLSTCKAIDKRLLDSIGKLNKLQYLDLSNTFVNKGALLNTMLESIGNFKELRHLNLSNCCVDYYYDWDKKIEHIRNLEKLEYLGLVNCSVTDKGFEVIGELKKLKFLYLYSNENLTDEGLRYIEHLQELRHLDLMDCKEITVEGLKTIIKFKELEYLNIYGTSIINNIYGTSIINKDRDEVLYFLTKELKKLKFLNCDGRELSGSELKSYSRFRGKDKDLF